MFAGHHALFSTNLSRVILLWNFYFLVVLWCYSVFMFFGFFQCHIDEPLRWALNSHQFLFFSNWDELCFFKYKWCAKSAGAVIPCCLNCEAHLESLWSENFHTLDKILCTRITAYKMAVLLLTNYVTYWILRKDFHYVICHLIFW